MDEAAKKNVLRQFTYGLYIVTVRDGETVNGFTANWVSQVSFTPPFVAVSVENDSASLPMIRSSGEFAVCVLEAGQRGLAGQLGKSLNRAPDKMDGISIVTAPGGFPVLGDSLGAVVCRVTGELPCGDSTLVLGEVVEAVEFREGSPLGMREAGFRHAG